MTTNFSVIEDRINKFLAGTAEIHSLTDVSMEHLLYLTHCAFKQSPKNILLVTENETESLNLKNTIQSLDGFKNYTVHTILGSTQEAYSGVYPSNVKFFQKLRAMSRYPLSSNKGHVIIVDSSATLELFPTPQVFTDNILELGVGDSIDPDDAAELLVELGFNPSHDIDEPGTFVNKGEVLDIFPINSKPIRVFFDLDVIEKIFFINQATGKTIKENVIEHQKITFAPNFILNDKFKEQLKLALPNFNLEKKDLLLSRREILSKINQAIPFTNFPYFFVSAFKEKLNIIDYFSIDIALKTSAEKHERDISLIIDELNKISPSSLEQVLPLPNSIFSLVDPLKNFKKTIEIRTFSTLSSNNFEQDNYQHSSLETINTFISKNIQGNEQNNVLSKINSIASLIKKGFTITFAGNNEKAFSETAYLLKNEGINELKWEKIFLSYGFIDHASKKIVLTENDLFVKKEITKKSHYRTQNDDFFAELISNLSAGDYVMHKTHGIGRYIGMEEMESNGSKTDFLIIEYDKQDKIYLPIYRINEIQKHGNNESKTYRLANLRTKNFLLQKKKIQNSIKKLAFDLIQLQAKRSLSDAYAFSAPDHSFEEFELSFPFNETPDQSHAIDRVLKDMQKKLPMDHLVCGDVGFGKTEVAIRAAFKAVVDQKQVAVLVPTTILALQHFNSFSRRLKNTGANVKVLTRFQGKKESDEIIKNLEEGKIDILIGTHKILSNKVTFSDLGLVVIDEEQRFGVNHKEKFKNLKESIDFLTLTATPIPRTMQMSLMGLKEISLIKTPPPNRQSISTFICIEEDKILKEAIEKEVNRGGQVFIVNNNVKDLDSLYQRIKSLVPNAKISIGHGQMPEKELEKTILDFYQGSSQVLLATTIIESGIDIPNANTMIVLNSDKFGLSQLHQLRGRIGRSDRKAFVYFTIKSQIVSDVASKRLKALQRFSDLGAGFSIASSDLEIRGAGNIIGGDQSGHLDQIGLELYSELLDEAIRDIKGEKKQNPTQTEVNSIFPAFIPHSYIKNNKIRLKLYKKLSNIKDLEVIDHAKEDISDQFGRLPVELENLIKILKLRIIFSALGVKTLTILKNRTNIVFSDQFVKQRKDITESLIQLITRSPNKYQLSQDYKFSCLNSKPNESGNFYQQAKDIADSINPC